MVVIAIIQPKLEMLTMDRWEFFRTKNWVTFSSFHLKKYQKIVSFTFQAFWFKKSSHKGKFYICQNSTKKLM
jgi:hypothetical protein